MNYVLMNCWTENCVSRTVSHYDSGSHILCYAKAFNTTEKLWKLMCSTTQTYISIRHVFCFKSNSIALLIETLCAFFCSLPTQMVIVTNLSFQIKLSIIQKGLYLMFCNRNKCFSMQLVYFSMFFK